MTMQEPALKMAGLEPSRTSVAEQASVGIVVGVSRNDRATSGSDGMRLHGDHAESELPTSETGKLRQAGLNQRGSEVLCCLPLLLLSASVGDGLLPALVHAGATLISGVVVTFMAVWWLLLIAGVALAFRFIRCSPFLSGIAPQIASDSLRRLGASIRALPRLIASKLAQAILAPFKRK